MKPLNILVAAAKSATIFQLVSNGTNHVYGELIQCPEMNTEVRDMLMSYLRDRNLLEDTNHYPIPRITVNNTDYICIKELSTWYGEALQACIELEKNNLCGSMKLLVDMLEERTMLIVKGIIK